jgi:hypothetical protein
MAPDLEIAHALADRGDHARAFHARDERQGRVRVEPGAHIDVDIIEPDRHLHDPDLARARIADLDLLPTKNLGSATLMHPDRVRHCLTWATTSAGSLRQGRSLSLPLVGEG